MICCEFNRCRDNGLKHGKRHLQPVDPRNKKPRNEKSVHAIRNHAMRTTRWEPRNENCCFLCGQHGNTRRQQYQKRSAIERESHKLQSYRICINTVDRCASILWMRCAQCISNCIAHLAMRIVVIVIASVNPHTVSLAAGWLCDPSMYEQHHQAPSITACLCHLRWLKHAIQATPNTNKGVAAYLRVLRPLYLRSAKSTMARLLEPRAQIHRAECHADYWTHDHDTGPIGPHGRAAFLFGGGAAWCFLLAFHHGLFILRLSKMLWTQTMNSKSCFSTVALPQVKRSTSLSKKRWMVHSVFPAQACDFYCLNRKISI